LLAEALRNQGRGAENREQIAGMLARDPEDALTHHSAGWAALQRGDHRAAESHFREALRISPGLEPAREGLLASFRSRSPFYRGYLRYCLWMARLKEKSQWAVVIGIYVGYRLVAKAAGAISPTLAFGVVALYLLLVLWAFVANAVGNFILLMDRFARHALKRREKIEGRCGGRCGRGGSGAARLGFGFGINLGVVLGAALAVGAIPWSLVFTNPSRAGRLLFGAVGVTVWLGATCFLAGMWTALQPLTDVGEKVLIAGGIGVIVTTWLAGHSGIAPLTGLITERLGQEERDDASKQPSEEREIGEFQEAILLRREECAERVDSPDLHLIGAAWIVHRFLHRRLELGVAEPGEISEEEQIETRTRQVGPAVDFVEYGIFGMTA
jgi:hypothetical protein